MLVLMHFNINNIWHSLRMDGHLCRHRYMRIHFLFHLHIIILNFAKTYKNRKKISEAIVIIRDYIISCANACLFRCRCRERLE